MTVLRLTVRLRIEVLTMDKKELREEIYRSLAYRVWGRTSREKVHIEAAVEAIIEHVDQYVAGLIGKDDLLPKGFRPADNYTDTYTILGKNQLRAEQRKRAELITPPDTATDFPKER